MCAHVEYHGSHIELKAVQKTLSPGAAAPTPKGAHAQVPNAADALANALQIGHSSQ